MIKVLINVHLLVNEVCECQNARCNNKKKTGYTFQTYSIVYSQHIRHHKTQKRGPIAALASSAENVDTGQYTIKKPTFCQTKQDRGDNGRSTIQVSLVSVKAS